MDLDSHMSIQLCVSSFGLFILTYVLYCLFVLISERPTLVTLTALKKDTCHLKETSFFFLYVFILGLIGREPMWE